MMGPRHPRGGGDPGRPQGRSNVLDSPGRCRSSRAWLVAVLAVVLGFPLTACEREARRFTTPAHNAQPGEPAPRLSANQPGNAQAGGAKAAARGESPYVNNAYAVNQGKRLFRWYNCSGCHAAGGGGMGPPLMDAEWRYGNDPANLFASIMQGRPNGMPSFSGHIPEDQAWQIVAYVQSMSGDVRKDVAPARSDTLSPGEAENARDDVPARREGPTQ